MIPGSFVEGTPVHSLPVGLRALGVEIGGAIGIPLYLAQALSVALYTIGFAESVARVFPILDARIVGLATTVLVTVVALISARVAIRAQYFIMGGIALSLLSFSFGQTATVEAAATFEQVPFWQVFAVFSPAVTGIMQASTCPETSPVPDGRFPVAPWPPSGSATSSI